MGGGKIKGIKWLFYFSFERIFELRTEQTE